MEKIKALKFAIVALIVALVSSLAVSCGSDDDDEIASYSFKVVLSGGGRSDVEWAATNELINAQQEQETVNTTESKAITAFNVFVNNLKSTLPETAAKDGITKDVNVECQLLKNGSVSKTEKFTVTPAK